MRNRSVSVVPSYLMVLVALTIAGVILAGVIAQVYLPLSKQKGYYGKSIEYRYEISGKIVYITLANKKNYDAKVDVILISTDNRVITACLDASIKSSLGNTIPRATEGGFSLLGIDVMGNEILDITCVVDRDVRDVRVNEYGVPEAKQGQAYIGNIGGMYYSTNVGFSLGVPWYFFDLYFRLPITVIVKEIYEPAYVEVTISPRTLSSDVWNFFKTHTRPDLNDVAVIDFTGTKYPTKAVRNPDGSIKVYFKVDRLERGVYYYHLYFGNPYTSSPIYPLNEDVKTNKLIPGPASLPSTIQQSMAFPAFIVPETYWLPAEASKRGVLITTSQSTFDTWVNNVRGSKSSEVLQLINDALKNLKDFPIGTANYWSYQPKTNLGSAPWASLVAVPLPSISMLANGTAVTTSVLVCSDDGAAAYLFMYDGTTLRKVIKYFDDAYSAHGPAFERSSNYWNYWYSNTFVPDKGVSMYLVVLQQNGICCSPSSWWCCWCGCGPGWLDFRFAMWYAEQMSDYAPSPSEFASIAKYIKVTIRGSGVAISKYAYPVDITGRPEIDWNAFRPDSVYVVDENGNPVYYWVQVEGGRTIIWIGVTNLPASGTRTYTVYYGGTNKYPDYNNPSKVFDFFDDFSLNPSSSGKWRIYTTGSSPSWDSANRVVYLIRNTYLSGVAMFMNIDWRTNFHVRFKMYVSGNADGLAFAFFKYEFPYTLLPYQPSIGGSLALDVIEKWTGVLEPAPGYAVEFDIYRNTESPVPHVALVETFSSVDVSDNTHYALTYNNFKDRWCTIDIYYYNGKLVVKIDNNQVLSYSGGVFSTYGIQYGGMAITAATGGQTGTFAIAGPVFLRYYVEPEPSVIIST